MYRVANIRQYLGFSLVELLVVLAIVTILASVAYPSYQGFIKQGYRASAQADLIALAAMLEKFKAGSYSYSGAAESGADTGTPTIYMSYSPSDEPSANKQYDLIIATVASDGSSYSLKANPVSGSLMAADGALWYFSDGRKAWDSNADNSLASSEYCWQC